MDLQEITRALVADLKDIEFAPPVTHVYNPLIYAAEPHSDYIRRYAAGPKEVLLVGMNPGPWGMAQTGIPFGEIEAVRDWLGIRGRVGQPEALHPQRPVTGFDCSRSEVSGKRLWGWAQRIFKSPQRFFKRFYVCNYCPLIFFDSAGRNLTPNRLKAVEKKRLLPACDRALQRTIRRLRPKIVVGVGKFAAERAAVAAESVGAKAGSITHPSPANPRANRGWEAIITEELGALGVRF